MGKHKTRRTRRRAESAAAARGASSREGYRASGTLEVSPPPAWHSAPPRCRLRISVAFYSFSCLRLPKDSWRGRCIKANRRSINSRHFPCMVVLVRADNGGEKRSRGGEPRELIGTLH